MNTARDSAMDDEEREAEGKTAWMGLQLSKEVASWAKQRGQQPDKIDVAPKQPAPEGNARLPSNASKKSNVSPVTSPARLPGRSACHTMARHRQSISNICSIVGRDELGHIRHDRRRTGRGVTACRGNLR